MIYRVIADLLLDTKTNKVTIQSKEGKRVVLYPSPKGTADWVDILIDDRPQNPQSSAKNLCRYIVQAFYSRKQAKQTLKETT